MEDAVSATDLPTPRNVRPGTNQPRCRVVTASEKPKRRRVPAESERGYPKNVLELARAKRQMQSTLVQRRERAIAKGGK